MPEPKILLFDIETGLNSGWFFDLFKEGNIVEIQKNWFMLSFAAKWLGGSTHCYSLADFPLYDTDRENDRELVGELWKLLDEADIVIAHNAKFDVRKSNARFVVNNMRPPSPYRTVCTLQLARRMFSFTSNRLDALGQLLGVGRKLAHTGKNLWLDVMAGDIKAHKKLKEYNTRDVELLERVYLKLRAWSPNHPNLSHYTKSEACPVCQSEKIKRSGNRYTMTGKRQGFLCKGCGHRFYAGPLIKAA